MSATPDTTERAHHPYSPSSLQMLEACPCYISHGQANEKAIAGTMAHAVVEAGADDMRLSDKHAEMAAECLDFFDKRKLMFEASRERANSEAKAKWEETGGDKVVIFPGPVLELTEVYLPIDDCVFDDAESTTAGYVDKVLIEHEGTYAEMFDWKFGEWPVEDAENNLQGMAYVLGLWKIHPNLDKVRFIFKQPAINVLSQAVFERKDVPTMYRRIQCVVGAAREARKLGDFSMARPMVPACNFCGNIGKCPKVAAIACKVGHKFWPVEIPADITPSQVLDPTQTTLAIRLAQVVKTWAESFRATVTNRVTANLAEPPPGYKLQEKRDREIVNREKFREVALKFITQAELDAAVKYSFTPIEDKIKENAPRGLKTAEVERFQKECLERGAVAKGEPYWYLRAVSTKNEKAATN